MTIFVIAGLPGCKFFNHARYVATYLEKSLPDFQLHIIEISNNEWKHWITKKNEEFGWYHFTSPVVWKELMMRGGTPHYIGGLSEFWEYCYDYYNLESILPPEDLQNLVNESEQYYYNHEQWRDDQENLRKQNRMIICISGDYSKFIYLVVSEILSIREVFDGKQILIRIFDDGDLNFKKNDIQDVYDIVSRFQVEVELINDIRDGIFRADLLIVTGNFTRQPEEEFYKWLNRNYLSMNNLARIINEVAQKSLRVVMAMHGPVCFNAAVLMDAVTSIKLRNIVAITADVALEVVNQFSECGHLEKRYLYSPPVWGFIGISQIIDLEHMIQFYGVYRPNKRAMKSMFGKSTLHMGAFRPELRYCNSNDWAPFWLSLYEKRMTANQKPHKMCMAKLRAIKSLLENWYSTKEPGNIISLGVISSGAFGIPLGIVFSQPVQLKNGQWEAVKEYPVPIKNCANIDDLIEFIIEICNRFNIRDNVLGRVNKIFKL